MTLKNFPKEMSEVFFQMTTAEHDWFGASLEMLWFGDSRKARVD